MPGLLDANGRPFKAPDWSIQIDGFTIAVKCHGKNDFSVSYGLQTRSRLNYSEAAGALGAALLHALATAGLFDKAGHI